MTMSIKGILIDRRISLGSIISAVFVALGMLWAVAARDADLKAIRVTTEDHRARISSLEKHVSDSDLVAERSTTALEYIRRSLEEIKASLEKLRDKK